MRETINSQTIRERCPDEYKDVFSSCQIVVSAADSFFWTGEYARFFGGLTVMQKLPTKNLVGLEILPEKKFVFADHLFGYKPTRSRFESVPYDTSKTIRLLNYLKELWPTLDPDGQIMGLRIHILSESHCGGGLGTTGVTLACLAACLLILAGKIKPEELDRWETASTHNLTNNPEYNSFLQVYRLAWRLTAICRDGNSSGATSFAALISSPYPIIYFSDNIHAYLNHPTICEPKNNLENCQIVEEIPFWGAKMAEFFPMRTPQPWPIDIGRIYSGTLINTENIFKSLSRLETNAEFLMNTVLKEMAPKIDNPELSISNLFDLESGQTFSNTYRYYHNIFNILAVRLIFALKELFVLGPQEYSLRKFITVINQIQDLNHFLGHSTPALDKICQRITEAAAEDNDLNLAGAKIEGIGKGGHAIFIGPAGPTYDKAVAEVEKLASHNGKNVFMDWASWIDGFGEDGLKIEQYLPNGKLSPFTAANDYYLTSYVKGKPHFLLAGPNNFETILKTHDITLFRPTQKIYIRDLLLSSKEIPSAKTTINIIEKVVKSPDCSITNKLFSDTSYGQSRYDLQSKILIPLSKILQRVANAKLDFHIKGGMYDNYSLCLNIRNINIAIVENISDKIA